MPKRGLRVLVVGAGGREHALAWKLRGACSVERVWCAPGNSGTAELGCNLPIGEGDLEGIANAAVELKTDLVVIGPEAPLAAGLADQLHAEGVAVFGPTRRAAELEWSKAFAKRFMHEHRLPTADFQVFDDRAKAHDYLASARFPLVVKADGLAAGKGVTICHAVREAERAVNEAMLGGRFGQAGRRIVIEEFLEGEEISLIALTDGERVSVLPPARDYKRLLDGDVGPNTGGMGCYAPVESVSPSLIAEITRTILEPTVAALANMGRPYRGALYAGLMLAEDGPKLLEFNCRFGDPETQVLMPLLDEDLAELLLACATGTLPDRPIRTVGGAAVCLSLASGSYPEPSTSRPPISGIDRAREAGATVFHAGTALDDGQLVAAGGRVLSVVSADADLERATEHAYEAAGVIQFDGRQLRRDLAARHLASRVSRQVALR
ncbi:MAG: phosphoribosylamine--glycine ligase [Chloroflexota bacterium]